MTLKQTLSNLIMNNFRVMKSNFPLYIFSILTNLLLLQFSYSCPITTENILNNYWKLNRSATIKLYYETIVVAM